MKRIALGIVAIVLLFARGGSPVAAELHVATTGDDRFSGSEATPYRTIRRALDVASRGDTILLHAGTYEERISTQDGPIRGGQSWADALTIAAIPGEAVVLQPPAGSTRVVMLADPIASFIVFRGLVLDASRVSHEAVKITWTTFGPSNGSHHIRIEDSEVMNAPGQGLLVGGHHNEFVRLRVHDNGRTDLEHGLYITGPDNLVDGCEVYRNAGWGVHLYNGDANDVDRNVIRNNRIRDNARVGRRGAGIVLSSGRDNIAFNNVIFGNQLGIQVAAKGVRSRVYNNTIFAQTSAGIEVDDGAVDSDIRNNLVFGNASGIKDAGKGTAISSNLVNVDPGVVDASGFDVRLTSTSAAVDKGESLDAVATDHDRRPRPQGAGYDIGAYEAR